MERNWSLSSKILKFSMPFIQIKWDNADIILKYFFLHTSNILLWWEKLIKSNSNGECAELLENRALRVKLNNSWNEVWTSNEASLRNTTSETTGRCMDGLQLSVGTLYIQQTIKHQHSLMLIPFLQSGSTGHSISYYRNMIEKEIVP